MRASGVTVSSSVTSAVHNAAEHHAGQQQAWRAAARIDERCGSELAPGEREHQHGRGQRAAGRAALDQQTTGAEQHRAERTDRSTARGAHHVRIGQRVAQQHLHQRAGQRKQTAGAEGGERTRQAQLVHDLRIDAAIGREEHAQQFERRYGAAAERERHGQRRRRESGERQTDAPRARHDDRHRNAMSTLRKYCLGAVL